MGADWGRGTHPLAPKSEAAPLSSTSLIVTGLALDLAGAVLVAAGALIWTKSDIVLRHVPTPGDLQSASPQIRKDTAALWTARVGACLLVAGFALQLAGQT